MRLTKSHNSEFNLYESIVCGKLRPFLTKYPSSENIESLAILQKGKFEDRDFYAEKENILQRVEDDVSDDLDLQFEIEGEPATVTDADATGTEADTEGEGEVDFLEIEKMLESGEEISAQDESEQAEEAVEDLDFSAEMAATPGDDATDAVSDLDLDFDLEIEIQEKEERLAEVETQGTVLESNLLTSEDVEQVVESEIADVPFQGNAREEVPEPEDYKFDKFEGLNIPRPPDKKAEFFLSLIEDEFEEIQKRAKKFLQNVKKEKLISLFANENLQKAKKLAINSGNLSRLLNIEYSDFSSQSDAYTINVLEIFLIRSILFYQDLFKPFLKNPLLTKNELRTYVDNPYVFSFKGEYWQINFNGEETWIRDLESTRYIVHLLDHPNKEFYCYDLTTMVKKNHPETNQIYSNMGEEELAKEGLSLIDLPIESLTKEDKTRLEALAYNVWKKYKELSCDSNYRVEKAKKEWEAVQKHLLNEYGIVITSSNNSLFFKINARFKIELERARSNVTKNIKNAIKSLGKQIPALANHLTKGIQTGAKCCYHPDPMIPINWTILWNN